MFCMDGVSTINSASPNDYAGLGAGMEPAYISKWAETLEKLNSPMISQRGSEDEILRRNPPNWLT